MFQQSYHRPLKFITKIKTCIINQFYFIYLVKKYFNYKVLHIKTKVPSN